MAPRKEVRYNQQKKSVTLHLKGNEIIESKDGTMTLHLEGNKASEFIDALGKQTGRQKDIATVRAPLPTGTIIKDGYNPLDPHSDYGSFRNKFSWTEDTYNTNIYQHIFTSTSYRDKVDIYVAMDLYIRDSLVRRIIELMVQFSLDTLSLVKTTKKRRDWYYAWMKQIGIYRVLRWFFMDYYRAANVNIMRFNLPFKETRDFDERFFKVKGSDNDDELKRIVNSKKVDLASALQIQHAGDFLDKAKKVIPYRYTILDPRLVTNEIPNGLQFGRVKYFPNAEMIEILNQLMSKAETKRGIPADMKRRLDKPINGVVLDPSFAAQYFRMKQPYEYYGIPLSSSAMPHIQMKNKLRDMDLSIIDSVKNKILKVTIGDKDFPAHPDQMSLMANNLEKPGQVLTILWNHTLDMEWIEPTFTDLAPEKYENVNKDIREAFGITPVLLGNTKGQSYATAYVSMKAFVENLRDGIDTAIEFLNHEFELIAMNMGFDSAPEARIDAINLTDTHKFIQLAQTAAQQGAISNQFVCEALGADWETEVQRMEAEKKLKEKEIIKVESPNTKSKDDDKKSEEEKLKSLQDNKTGIPPEKRGLTNNNTENQKKEHLNDERTAAAIDLFKLRHIGSVIYSKLDDYLTRKDMDNSYKSIANLMSVIPRDGLAAVSYDFSKIDMDKLKDMDKGKNPELLFGEIERLKKEIGMKRYTKAKMADICAEAWAIYYNKYII